MSKKDSNFFEEHIEKIVLAIVGIVCFWLLITRILFSPNYIKYDNDKFDAGTIDNHISKQTDALETRLNRKPEQGQPYQPQADKFIALLDSAISDIDIGLILPQPVVNSRGVSDNKTYRIPLIGEANEVSVGHIRAVAYVPKAEAGTETVYDQSNSEPNDIDFVTIEAKFDVSGLYKRFHECFAGEHIPQDWRNGRLANPVFAAVQLQRQKLLSDGSWSDWQTVPRSKIDTRKEMLKVVENVGDLPAGGVKVRMLQFDDAKVRMDILQPIAYQIASAKEEWFPPSLHGKYTTYQREKGVIERREAAAEKREERAGNRAAERPGRTTPAEATRPTAGGGRGASTDSRGAVPATTRRTPPRKTEQDIVKERPQKGKEASTTIDDIYQEFNEISLTESTDFAGIDKPLLFWAHDDTAEPGKSYRYKIRLGVFNPIAGTNQFGEQDKSLKDKVILWSNFSDTTEAVDIPETLYLFPREVQEATRTVTVQVSRYVLGYWYSKDFMVKQGELIGEAGEYKITEEEGQKSVTVPKMVNYATGAVLVDIVPVNDWSGGNNLHARHFLDMLYSFDGKNIEHLPTKTGYWTEALLSKYNEIKRAEKEPKEPLRGREGRTGQPQRTPMQDERPAVPGGDPRPRS